jgi:hypothetical protein
VITQDRPVLPLVSYIHHARQLQRYVLTPPVCYICNMVYTPGVLTVRAASNEVNERTCTSAYVIDDGCYARLQQADHHHGVVMPCQAEDEASAARVHTYSSQVEAKSPLNQHIRAHHEGQEKRTTFLDCR